MNAGQLIKVLQTVPEDTEVKFETDVDIYTTFLYSHRATQSIGNVVHIENNVLLLSEE